MRFIVWVLTTSAGLAVAAWVLPGIWFEGVDAPFGDEVKDKILPLLATGLVMAVISRTVEPVVTLLSLPFIIVTIGLFLLVINALMLLLAAWVADLIDLGFHVDGFWWAVLGSIIITLVTGFIDAALREDE